MICVCAWFGSTTDDGLLDGPLLTADGLSVAGFQVQESSGQYTKSFTVCRLFWPSLLLHLCVEANFFFFFLAGPAEEEPGFLWSTVYKLIICSHAFSLAASFVSVKRCHFYMRSPVAATYHCHWRRVVIKIDTEVSLFGMSAAFVLSGDRLSINVLMHFFCLLI